MAEIPDDRRQRSPATARNRDPILAVLRRILPAQGAVLEIAAGAGEHAVHFARAFPGLAWQPSDPDANARASIAAWTASEDLPNIAAPLAIDVGTDDWGVAPRAFDAVLAINMIHISPWESTLGLLAGAARALKPGGLLYLYGPYKREGRYTAPSNETFDASLKARDPRWGVRNLSGVEEEARAQGFALREVVEMPANNLSVIFENGA